MSKFHALDEQRLVELIEHHTSELRRIHTAAGDGDLNPAQQTRWNKHQDELTIAQGELAQFRQDRDERRAKVLAAADTARPADGARDFQYQRHAEPVDTDEVARLSGGEARDRALALLARTSLQSDQLDRVDGLFRSHDPDLDGGYLAKRALITETPEYRSAFSQVLATPHPVLTDGEARALRSLKLLEREMNITTPGDGGYGVPVMIDPTIIITDQGSSNPFLSIANIKTITTKDWRGVSAAGVTWAFETESAAANDISPTLAQPIIHAHKAQGAIPYTIEVGMDYPDFAEEIAKVLGSGYDELLVDKLTRGTGTGEPWGIFKAADQATSQVIVTTDGTFSAADVKKAWVALPERFKGRASWMFSYDVGELIQDFGNDEKSAWYSTDIKGVLETVRQRPVHYSAYAPAFTGTTGAASILVVGDFSAFVVAQRAGMSIEPVQHLLDTTTGLPTGQRAFYAWTRVGADVVNDGAFRLLVNS